MLAKNFWTIKLFEPGEKVPKMAEPYVAGFQIQVIKDAEIFPYNPANAVDGESSPNPLDIRFKLTTRAPHKASLDQDGAIMIVIPPVGFTFPSVCRNFLTDTGVSGYFPLPSGSECNPEGFLNPELRQIYYRINHPNFAVEFGSSETMIADDIIYEPFYRNSTNEELVHQLDIVTLRFRVSYFLKRSSSLQAAVLLVDN